jgi:hypothetical protein
MHAILTFFGPKATLPTVILFFIIAPIAIWHHVHLVIEIVKHIRKEWSE